MNKYEEGDTCLECGNGVMHYPKVEGCYCHITSPCSACVDNRLTCNNCGWEAEDE